MKVRVLYFAQFREAFGKSEETIDLPEGSSARDLLTQRLRSASSLTSLEGRVAVAVNGEIAKPGTVLSEGDEVVILPPMSGG